MFAKISVFNYVSSEIEYPDFLIYVKCPVNVVMERIKARNRNVEKGISIDYLLSLEHKIEENTNAINSDTKLIIVDSNKFDYVSNMDQQNKILQKIQQEVILT